MPEPLLDITGLSVSYHSAEGELRALRNVTLRLEPGRILGIVGESGCGKSTLVNAILRLLPSNARITGGRVVLQGEDLLALDEAAMQAVRGRRMSIVLQDPMSALNPVLSIGRQMVNVQFRQQRTAAQKRDRAVEMLSLVGINDPERRLHQYAHELSGGMRQRVCIAMALMVEPDLLICDEPTTALDATLEVQVLDLIRRLQADIGCGVLFISHHLGVIAELCDHVAVMYAGEVVEQAEVRDLFHQPVHPYTERLLACDPARAPKGTRRLPVIEGSIPDLARLPAGCVFRARCSKAIDRCGREVPPLETVRQAHWSRCHAPIGVPR